MSWPIWRPGQELRASHLYGLEAYLLARSMLIDEGAFGVEILNWRESVKLEILPDEADPLVVARGLKGATPGGLPVLLRTTESLGAQLDTRGRTHCLFDLWIDVAQAPPPTGSGQDEADSDGGRLTLFVEAHYQHPPPAAVVPGRYESRNRLYLGRYRAADEASSGEWELTLEGRPMPRRLGGFGAVDSPLWRQWVQPLSARLDDLWQRVQVQGGDEALRLTLAVLRFEWPALPILELARKLRTVAFLASPQTAAGSDREAKNALAPFHEYWTISGEQLPAKLAELLPAQWDGPRRRQEGPHDQGAPQSKGIENSLPAVLDALDGEGVRFHAPLGALQAWCNDLRNAAPTEAERARILQIVEQPPDSRPAAAGWTDAVKRITRATVDTTSPYGQEAVRSLEALWGKEAKAAEAGPAAFSFLARAAARAVGASPPALAELKRYVAALESGERLASRDRVAFYLDRLRPGSEALRSLVPARKLGRRSPRRDALWIHIVGPPGSGRQTLARELVAGCNQRLRGSFQPFAGGPLPDLVQGSIQLSGSSVALAISVGAPSSDPAGDAPSGSTALLLVTIDPKRVDADDRNAVDPDGALARQCARALQSSTDGLIAFAFTKADEYGVINPEGIRIVGQSDAIYRYVQERSRSSAKAWNNFVDRLCRGSRETPSGVVLGTGDSAPKVYRQALEQSRTLWDAALEQGPARFLDGYFVAAAPLEPILSPLANRGLLQILIDAIGLSAGPPA